LRACGVERVVSFRAGDFGANEDTLNAMEAVGLHLSSNRALDQKSSIRSRLNDTFPVRNDLSAMGSMTDVPVTALRSSLPFLDGPYRHMEISAMGLGEIKDGLTRMQQAGYACAGILTHPGEFYRYDRQAAVPIRKNCRRLKGLLDFVTAHPHMEFLAVSDVPRACSIPSSSPPELKTNAMHSLVRAVEQVVDRLRARGFLNRR